jgi:hypothetical protein
MTTTPDTCWADPLTSTERRVLREKLARTCKRFYDEAQVMGAQWPAHKFTDREVALARGLTVASAEMADLYTDVTERAQVPPERRRPHA